MARLTWRNVDSPDFRGVSDMLARAQQGFSGAATTLGSAAKEYHGSQVNDRSNAAMLNAMKYTESDNWEEALKSGAFTAGVSPTYLNSTAMQYFAGRRGGLLGEEGQIQKQDLAAQANARAAEKHKQSMAMGALRMQMARSGGGGRRSSGGGGSRRSGGGGSSRSSGGSSKSGSVSWADKAGIESMLQRAAMLDEAGNADDAAALRQSAFTKSEELGYVKGVSGAGEGLIADIGEARNDALYDKANELALDYGSEDEYNAALNSTFDTGDLNRLEKAGLGESAWSRANAGAALSPEQDMSDFQYSLDNGTDSGVSLTSDGAAVAPIETSVPATTDGPSRPSVLNGGNALNSGTLSFGDGTSAEGATIAPVAPSGGLSFGDAVPDNAGSPFSGLVPREAANAPQLSYDNLPAIQEAVAEQNNAPVFEAPSSPLIDQGQLGVNVGPDAGSIDVGSWVQETQDTVNYLQERDSDLAAVNDAAFNNNINTRDTFSIVSEMRDTMDGARRSNPDLVVMGFRDKYNDMTINEGDSQKKASPFEIAEQVVKDAGLSENPEAVLGQMNALASKHKISIGDAAAVIADSTEFRNSKLPDWLGGDGAGRLVINEDAAEAMAKRFGDRDEFTQMRESNRRYSRIKSAIEDTTRKYSDAVGSLMRVQEKGGDPTRYAERALGFARELRSLREGLGDNLGKLDRRDPSASVLRREARAATQNRPTIIPTLERTVQQDQRIQAEGAVGNLLRFQARQQDVQRLNQGREIGETLRQAARENGQRPQGEFGAQASRERIGRVWAEPENVQRAVVSGGQDLQTLYEDAASNPALAQDVLIMIQQMIAAGMPPPNVPPEVLQAAQAAQQSR